MTSTHHANAPSHFSATTQYMDKSPGRPISRVVLPESSNGRMDCTESGLIMRDVITIDSVVMMSGIIEIRNMLPLKSMNESDHIVTYRLWIKFYCERLSLDDWLCNGSIRIFLIFWRYHNLFP